MNVHTRTVILINVLSAVGACCGTNPVCIITVCAGAQQVLRVDMIGIVCHMIILYASRQIGVRVICTSVGL